MRCIPLSRLLCLALLLCVASPLFAQDRPRILGISHIAIKVTDLDKSLAFYRDWLGFPEQYRLDKNGALLLVTLKVSDEQYLEVWPGLKPEEAKLHQIAFHVQDAEVLRAHLATQGLKVPASVPKGQTQNANFSTQDPAGYTLEIVQYLPEGWTMRDQGKFLPDNRISSHISHAGVSVMDIPDAMKLYGEVLGMKEGWRGSRDGKEVSWIHMRVADGTDYVEYMLTKKPITPAARDAHFCFVVPDMPKSKATLDASPYRKNYTRPVDIIIGKNNKRILNLFDPDNIRVELMEPDTVDGKPTPPSDAPLPQPGI